MARLLGLGLPVGPSALLTVRGRVSGQPRTVPIVVLEHSGRRWLAAVFGEVDWVRNLRAAGVAILSRGRHRESVVAAELDPELAGRVLKDAVAPNSSSRMMRLVLRRSLGLKPHAPLQAFIAEARRHPVFALGEPARDLDDTADDSSTNRRRS